MRFRFHLATRLTLLAGGLLVGCGKEPIGPRTPSKLEIVSGNNQTGSAGTTLTAQLVVQASDDQGPLPGVSISSSAEAQGGGGAAPSVGTTGADGRVAVTWTLGSKLGNQSLTFSTAGVPSVSATALVTVGEPSQVSALSNTFQTAVVSSAVPEIPRVKVTDVFGNPIGGVTVTFELVNLGSVISGTTQVTTATGEAALGSWTIGPDAITYSVRARLSGGMLVLFDAQGVPATLAIIEGQGQTANAGTAVAIPPAVRAGRPDGSPLPGVPVGFVVASGGGSVQGSPAITGSDGIARLTRWVLGPTPGPNQLRAEAVGKDPLTITATGVVGSAVNIAATAPTNQSTFFGNYVASTPSVAVTDAGGNPVAGATVTFELVTGDGLIGGATQITGFDGVARLGFWRLGAAASHSVRASAGAATPVTFSATASTPPASTFSIEIRYTNTPTASQIAAFDQAVARWKSVILSGGPPYPVNEPATICFPAMNETVPGVVIFATLAPIDGINGTIGFARPCIVRDDPMYLSAVGQMTFDTADLAGIEATGRLGAVIMHEMGHVLGFGTLWDFLTNTLLTGRGTADPFFNGAATRGAFLGSVATGTVFTGNPVPVENSGGGGTRDSHWRETILTNELMTGIISQPGIPNPLSAFTATSFRDFGYVVNDAVADNFSFAASIQAALAGPGLALNEPRMTGEVLVINRRGQVVRRVNYK